MWFGMDVLNLLVYIFFRKLTKLIEGATVVTGALKGTNRISIIYRFSQG